MAAISETCDVTLYRILVVLLLEDADLRGNGSNEVAGYKPRRHAEVVQNRPCQSMLVLAVLNHVLPV